MPWGLGLWLAALAKVLVSGGENARGYGFYLLAGLSVSRFALLLFLSIERLSELSFNSNSEINPEDY